MTCTFSLPSCFGTEWENRMCQVIKVIHLNFEVNRHIHLQRLLKVNVLFAWWDTVQKSLRGQSSGPWKCSGTLLDTAYCVINVFQAWWGLQCAFFILCISALWLGLFWVARDVENEPWNKVIGVWCRRLLATVPLATKGGAVGLPKSGCKRHSPRCQSRQKLPVRHSDFGEWNSQRCACGKAFRQNVIIKPYWRGTAKQNGSLTHFVRETLCATQRRFISDNFWLERYSGSKWFSFLVVRCNATLQFATNQDRCLYHSGWENLTISTVCNT